MNIWELSYTIQSFLFDFLIYLCEQVLGIYSFQRIVSNARLTRSERLQLVEQQIARSSSEKLRHVNWESDTKEATQLLSGSFPDKNQHIDMVRRLAFSLGQIRGSKKLREQVESCRSTTYDSNNKEHEEKLLQLWTLLKPEEKLTNRKTLQWQSIGFQGDCPSTDFRGMGMLGLENLIYYAQNYPEECQKLLKLSENEIYGFPFAIAGITFTALCKQLLFESYLKNHFANALEKPPQIDDFHQVYSRVFTLFGLYWQEVRPENVMFFNSVKNDFVELLKKYLKKSKANLFETDLISLSAVKR
ncbi:ELMO domain-containing protein [Aphelenchoides bicaudatus]|nr:ELMO domain-containing protein [Aphelenchoides bicaudatus]